MIFMPDTVLQRATSILLVLYVGAFLGQALCVLHGTHMDSRTDAGMDRPTAEASSSTTHHASPSMATHALPSSEVHASPSMAAHSPSQHGEHSGTPGRHHSGACGAVACGSAITAMIDHSLHPMSQVSNNRVAYLRGMMPPDTETVPPPPRLG